MNSNLKLGNKQRANKARLLFIKSNKKCKNCGIPISFESRRNRFCNHSCAAIFTNNKRRGERSKNLGCSICNAEIESRSARHCNLCIKKSAYNRKSWSEVKNPQTRRKQLLSERGYRCEICKLTTWMGKRITIEMDHIDGDSDNNEKDNLRLLCPNCHSQTPTFKGKNRGGIGSSRQRKRRKRYMDGKTH